jgi:hypothetical protein
LSFSLSLFGAIIRKKLMGDYINSANIYSKINLTVL